MNHAEIIQVDYEHPGCATSAAWAKVPREPNTFEKNELITRIKHMLKEQDAVLVSHYYVHADLQDLAEETGGIVSDSLDMASFGHQHPGKTIIVAGVRSTWAEATEEEVAAFLRRWRTSRFGLLRAGYQALTQLILAAWYGNPASWERLGYPGPPALESRPA